MSEVFVKDKYINKKLKQSFTKAKLSRKNDHLQ